MRRAILILAAGSSSRMGQPKQLLPWGDTTLIGHAIGQARAVTDDVYVVLGANRDQIADRISEFHVKTLFNADHAAGMASSIACGVEALITVNKSFTTIIIMLVDQPQVDRLFLKAILEAHRGNPDKVIATAYPTHPGVPALFPKQYFADLLALGGHAGAGKWLESNADRVHQIHPAAPLYDIDTPEDYQRHEGDQERH